MKISKLSDIHLLNRINYFKRKLLNCPSEAIYIGDSVYAEDAVNSENAHNEQLALDIKAYIKEMEREAKRRKLVEVELIK